MSAKTAAIAAASFRSQAWKIGRGEAWPRRSSKAAAALVAVLSRREQGAEEQDEAVRVLVLAQRLAHQVERIAADLLHRAHALEPVIVAALDQQVHLRLAHLVDGEAVVEEADEGA